MSRTKYDFGLYHATPVADLKSLVDFAAVQYGERPAFIYQEAMGEETRRISYARYRQDIQEVACGLVNALKIDLGRRDSKRIALLAPNSYWWSVCYLAVTTINHIIVPLDPNLPTADLLAFMQRAGVSSLIFTSEIDDKIKQLKTQLAKIKHYISIDHSQQASISLEKIQQLGVKQLRKNAGMYDDVKVFPETLSTLIFTSGTTSTPKAVMLTHKNLTADVFGMKQLNEFDHETLLSMLPLYHSYEFMVGLLFQIYVGSTIYYMTGGLPKFHENLQKVRPSVLVLVPLIVEETYKRVCASVTDPQDQAAVGSALREYFGGRLTRIIDGGAPLNSDIAEAYDQAGIKLLQGYGISECAPVVSMNPDCYYKPRSVGMPLPNVRVKIFEADGDGIGEVIVRGPNVMLGYYKDERQTDKAIIDNWLHTGDYGRFDEDGFLYIVGRKKNVIVGKNAKKIYPEEVEYHLSCQPEIREALVYGKVIDDDTKVAALIVADQAAISKRHPELGTKPAAGKLEKLIGAVVDKVNATNIKYKAIVDWQLVDSLPRTSTGKVKRSLATS